MYVASVLAVMVWGNSGHVCWSVRGAGIEVGTSFGSSFDFAQDEPFWCFLEFPISDEFHTSRHAIALPLVFALDFRDAFGKDDGMGARGQSKP